MKNVKIILTDEDGTTMTYEGEGILFCLERDDEKKKATAFTNGVFGAFSPNTLLQMYVEISNAVREANQI